MIIDTKPLADVTTTALKVLYREIGVVDTVRFINQYTAGFGNYTQERRTRFAGMTLDEIVAEIEQRRPESR